MIETTKKKVLFLAHDQFGYSTTTFKHCEFARTKYDVTYIGWDYGLPRLELLNVRVKYISRNSNLIARNLNLLKAFHIEIENGYDIVFAKYLRGISLVRWFNPLANFIVYVDTLGVMRNSFKRFVFDLVLKLELSFFKHKALISEGVGKRLGIENFHILPLGGECYSNDLKSFENLSLLYVGTLDNRNILDCVKGFHNYIENCKKTEMEISARFTIVGDSPYHELEEIRGYIQRNNLEVYIHSTGYVPRNDLRPFFEKCNIGVSYIPIRSYYQYQPPTKTYEYLISGMPTIATGTYENKALVGPGAGVVIDDTPESFQKGILKLTQQKFDSEAIRKEYSQHTWEKVVQNHFIPLIEKHIMQ